MGLRLLKYFNSPLPVLEPAATLHKGADFDLDFTLERGMVEFWNPSPRAPPAFRSAPAARPGKRS